MEIVLVLNTILCIVGFLAAFGMQMGAGYAWDRHKNNPLSNLLVGITLAFFLTPIVSIAGSWLSHGANNAGLAWVFVALPYVHFLIMLALLLILEH